MKRNMYEELVESQICKLRNFKVNIVPISEINLKYIYLSIYLSICLSVCLSVCLHI